MYRTADEDEDEEDKKDEGKEKHRDFDPEQEEDDRPGSARTCPTTNSPPRSGPRAAGRSTGPRGVRG